MIVTFFNGLDELYRLAKFREDRTTRAGCRFENMVFYVCFASRLAHCSFEGYMHMYCVAV